MISHENCGSVLIALIILFFGFGVVRLFPLACFADVGLFSVYIRKDELENVRVPTGRAALNAIFDILLH